MAIFRSSLIDIAISKEMIITIVYETENMIKYVTYDIIYYKICHNIWTGTLQ